ncbi:MAG: protease-like activity factor CPAF [Chlamydiales bacterium]|nr:protease-like activity factor CPAF [Chlamydiales bacterium]
MKTKTLFAALLAGVLLTGTSFATPAGASLTKRRVLSDLETIHTIFEVKYAPLKWKGEFAHWELDQAILEAKSKVETIPNPNLKECQSIIRDFFNSTRDYHVGVRFYSTESASLPFIVKGAQNRYFVCDVDRSELPTSSFPFEIGDEILTFDGRPIHEVIGELRRSELGLNTYETDLALAEILLTNRHGAMGNRIPQGSVVVTGKGKGSDKIVSTTLKWDYIPEKIRDLSKIGAAEMAFEATPMEWKYDFQTALKKSRFFEKFMLFHQWDRSYVGASTYLSSHALGSRSSYLPPLGKKIWKSGFDWMFDAYIFETLSGKRVGYIRIPHYMADVEELDEFGEIVSFFQTRTNALIIDQLNNPGGSVFYLYALASTLTDKPLYAPKHHIALTQEEVHSVLCMLPYLDQVTNDSTARSVLGDEVGGYPVNYEFVSFMKKFCNFLIEQWNQGKLCTEPTHLFGVDQIKPHPRYRYTKPILLLINSLDFSGGDFFPAIMQDNKRATLMGTRTAGAGGYLLSTTFPNHSGIKAFVMTGSLAERIDKNPIENLGVQPDIHYELTAEDLQEDFQPFASRIVEAVESLMK